MGNNGAGTEIQELIKMVNVEIVNALRDIFKLLEEMAQKTDVENVIRKVVSIEDIKKRYPWLKRPITYKRSK